MRVLIILFALLALTACGQKSGKVKLELTSSFTVSGPAALGASAAGGLMVWGISNKGDSFSRVLTSSTNIELDVPNGQWTFTAVAWESGATGNPALVEFDNEGLRCARSTPMDLKGEDVQVNLEMTSAKCNQPSFRGGSSAQIGVKLNLCQNALAVGSINDACTNDPSPASNRKSDKAPVRSVRLRMMEFDKFGNNVVATGPGLSRCIEVPSTLSGLWNTPTDLAIPVGDPTRPGENPFRMEIEFYWSSQTCSGGSNLDFGVTQLPKGLVSPGHKFFVDATDNHVAYINVRDQLVCTGRETATAFDIGDGSQEHPYVICSVAQLQKIHETAFTKSYRLAADIDLNDSTKGLATAVLPPNAAACWELGQTWQPIGYRYDSSCILSRSSFNGSFYGGGHTIKNLRTRFEDSYSVGFIGVWNPTVYSNRGIRELTLRDIEVSGLYQVGGLLGYKDPTMLGRISDIRIDNARIEAKQQSAEAFAGGAIGSVDNASLSHIRVENTHVRAEVSKVGGVFGQVTNAVELRNIFSHAIVASRSGSYHGGVAGYMSSTSTGASYGVIRHEGAVISGGDHVGGLFGEVSLLAASGVLNDMYATSAIHVFKSGTTQRVGGLFGATNFFTYNNMFFAGAITIKGTPSNTGRIVGSPPCAPSGCTGTNIFYMGPTPDFENGSGINNSISVTSYPNELSEALYTNSTILNSGPWEHTANSLPRFKDENHPCADVANLRSLGLQIGRGDAANPYAVCRKDQLAAVGGLGANKHVRLMAPINMTGAFTPPSIPAGVTLDGAGQVLFGYKTGMSATAAGDRAPFSSILGTLKNVQLVNMSVKMTASTGASTVSGLAMTNSGVIDGVEYLSGDISQQDPTLNKVAGLVQTNSGTIRNVGFHADVGGQGSISGLVTENSGTIEDSVVGGTLFNSGSASPINNVAGIANLNRATIRRVVVESRLDLNVSASNLSMGVVRNNPNAVLSDLNIDSQAEWRVAAFGTNTTVFASRNYGAVERALMRGRLLDTDISSSNTTDTYLGRTVVNDTIVIDNVSYTGIYRGMYTQFPAGRLIASGSGGTITTNCTDSTVGYLRFTPFGSAFVAASNYFDNSGAADDDLLSNEKYVWVVAEKDGELTIARATGSYLSTFENLKLNVTCASAPEFMDSSANIYVIQSYGNNAIFTPDTISSGNFSGVVSKNFFSAASLPANLGLSDDLSPWKRNVLIEANATNTIINYYFQLLAGNQPTRPAPWMLESEGSVGDLRLFDSN